MAGRDLHQRIVAQPVGVDSIFIAARDRRGAPHDYRAALFGAKPWP
jgi:hypothetical protein